MILEILGWGLGYMAYLVLQSWVIVGVYLSAEGSTEVLPDGAHRDGENILYPVYKWLHRTERRDRVYLGEQLDDLLRALERAGLWSGEAGVDYTFNWGRLLFTSRQGYDAFVATAPLVQRQFGVTVAHGGGDLGVVFYKTFHEYRLSKYVRKPTLGCVRCMASLWSLLTYALPCWYVWGWNRTCFALWIPTVFALAFLNSYFYRKQK